MELTGKQRRYLRSLAHHLDPVVQVGQAGVTEAVLAKVDQELEHHELIKVKVLESSLLTAGEAAPLLGAVEGAAVAQTIGRVVLMYRKRQKDPEIRLPK